MITRIRIWFDQLWNTLTTSKQKLNCREVFPNKFIPQSISLLIKMVSAKKKTKKKTNQDIPQKKKNFYGLKWSCILLQYKIDTMLHFPIKLFFFPQKTQNKNFVKIILLNFQLLCCCNFMKKIKKINGSFCNKTLKNNFWGPFLSKNPAAIFFEKKILSQF